MPTYLNINQTKKIQQASVVIPQPFTNYKVFGNLLQITVEIGIRAVVLLDIELAS